MPSTFQSIDIASSALSALQQALDVTGQNVSNVNTPGYTREVANFVQNPSSSIWDSQGQQWLGNGVGIADVTRVQSGYLVALQNSNASDLGKTNAQLSGSQQVQSVFNEPSTTGINSALSSFFNAWSALSSNPSDPGTLTQVQQAGENLTNLVSGNYTNLANLQIQNKSQIQGTITQIQTLANQIGQLNQQIGQWAGPTPPNSLMDQRDQAVNQLSQLVDIHTTSMPNGEVGIAVNQFDLVDSAGAHTFPTQVNAATGTVSDGVSNYNVYGGQLAGEMNFQNNIVSAQAGLDNLANTLRTSVNALTTTGTNSLGATGQNFFQAGVGITGAAQFALDPAILSNPGAIPAGVSGKSGDGGLAEQVFQLQNASQASLGNVSITNYYQNLVTGIGQQVSNMQSLKSSQTAVSSQIQSQIQSISGVNMDTEMASMLKYQQAYAAAAKSLSIASQNLQSLIAMVP